MNDCEIYAWWEDIVNNFHDKVIVISTSQSHLPQEDYVRINVSNELTVATISIQIQEIYYEMFSRIYLSSQMKQSFGYEMEFQTNKLLDILRSDNRAMKFLSDISKVNEL